MENKENNDPDTIKDFHKNELTENNSFYDITGNMSVWKVHETYEGSGNDNIWEEIQRNLSGSSSQKK